MIMTFRYGLIVAGLILGITPALGTVADFRTASELGVDASLVAVGNGMGWGETPAGVLVSPVGVGQKNGISASYWSVITDQKVAVIAGAYQLAPDWKLGAATCIESISGIYQSLENGAGQFEAAAEGTYTNSEVAIGLMHRVSNQLGWGVSATVVQKDILGTSAAGVGLSAAATWRTARMDTAITLRNLNQPTIVDSDGGQEVLPAELDIAGRYRGLFAPALELVARGTYRMTNHVVYPSVGIQVTPFSTDALVLSAGYAPLKGIDAAYRPALTVGVSLGLDAVTMHYAFLVGDVADSQLQHKLSVAIGL